MGFGGSIAIASRLAPTGIWVCLGETGRLSGRLRGQASLLQRQNQTQIRCASHHSTGRALARLQLLILPCCPFGRLSGGVDLGVGAKRRSTESNASRGGRSEADRRRCPQIDPGAKEPRAQARGRTPGQSLLVTFWRLKKSLAVRAKPPSAPPAATDMPPTPKNMVGPKAATPPRKTHSH
ncbi:hypothetical protein FBY12_4408 [Pseudomonas sp. SJZ131]|nr:hypothetical protein FBY12_4408 [Pseudomonas sp. SJZ131]